MVFDLQFFFRPKNRVPRGLTVHWFFWAELSGFQTSQRFFLLYVVFIFYFVIRDQFVGRQTGFLLALVFFSKETVQKVWKASPISVSTLYPFCYKAGDTNCRVSLFWTCSSLTYIFTLCFTFLYDCFFPKKQFRKFSKSDTYLLLPYILSVARVDTNYV